MRSVLNCRPVSRNDAPTMSETRSGLMKSWLVWASTLGPGAKTTVGIPASSSRRHSRTTLRWAWRRNADSGPKPAISWADIGDTMMTTSSSCSRNTSAFVGECTPPST